MKRFIFHIILSIILLAAGAAGLSSCAEEPLEIESEPTEILSKDGFLTLHLNCLPPDTRAPLPTEDGLESLNENLISSATICLWPKGGDWLDTRDPYFIKTYDNLQKQGEAIIRIPLTDDLITHLFNTESTHTCNVFVAVNVDPGTVKAPAAIRAMSIGSAFAEDQEQTSFAMDGTGTAEMVTLNGTVSALGKIDLKRSAAKIDLHIDVAEKVTEIMDDGTTHTWIPDLEKMTVILTNGVKESTLDPKPSEVASDAYFSTPVDLSYVLSKPSEEAEEHGVHNPDYPYQQQIPFYTYPNEWDSSDPDSPGRSFMTLRIPWSNDGGASYKVCYYRVPVVDPKLDELVRNTSYHVLLKVSVLGSFVPDEPMPLEDLSYKAAEWGTENIDVNIVEPRYLVVDQNDFDINNENKISIPFYTSHKTVVTDIKMTFYRFNYSDAGVKFPVTCTMEMNDRSKTRTGEEVFKYDFINGPDILEVEHDLVIYEPWRGDTNPKMIDLTNGDGSTLNRPKVVLLNEIIAKITDPSTGYRWFKKKTPVEDEYSKVEFEVTVQHEDMRGTNLFKETVRINQYPGMYLDAVANAYTAKENNTIISGTGAQAGAFINGNNTAYSLNSLNALAGNTANGYMTSIGLSSDNMLNWNPNLYLVTITRLPKDTEFILADPRASEINNLLTNESIGELHKEAWPEIKINGYSQAAPATATSLYWETTIKRQLAYYYPTREEKEAQNLISPKFRVCSSYAGTGAILNRMLARRRAASYQEAGYPAGRWRLPTFAEIKFLVKLAEDLKIPRLFGTKTTRWNYWCANGWVEIPPKTSSDKAHYEFMPEGDSRNNNNERTRFVYDEWYWGGETVNKNIFTWGDAPRR